MAQMFTIRCKAFCDEGVRWNRVLVDDGKVLVWDKPAGHYTTCHSLSRSALRRIRRHAAWLDGLTTNHLTNAAPDMLAALRAAVSVLTGWEFTSRLDEADGPTVRLCKAAIAKAEGRVS